MNSKIQIKISLKHIIDFGGFNVDSLDEEIFRLVDNLNDKFDEYNVSYSGVYNIDLESVNVVHLEILADSVYNIDLENEEAFQNVGAYKAKNMLDVITSCKGFGDYEVTNTEFKKY